MGTMAHPSDWPGTGKPPTFQACTHVAPYTLHTARWLDRALSWLEGQGLDARRRKTCRRVLAYIIAHTETHDSIRNGEAFVSVSVSTLAADMGTARATVRAALATLTQPGAPLRAIWHPKRGQKLGTCYKLANPVMVDNPTEIPAMSQRPVMEDNPTGISTPLSLPLSLNAQPKKEQKPRRHIETHSVMTPEEYMALTGSRTAQARQGQEQ